MEHGAEPPRADAHAPGQRRRPRAGRPRLAHMLRDHGLVASRREQGEMRHERRGLAPDAGRIDVEERAPTDGDDGRVRADDEPVAGHGHHGLLQPDPDEGALAWLQLGAIQQEDARHDLCGSRVEADPVARLERPRGVARAIPGSHRRGPRTPASRPARARRRGRWRRAPAPADLPPSAGPPPPARPCGHAPAGPGSWPGRLWETPRPGRRHATAPRSACP